MNPAVKTTTPQKKKWLAVVVIALAILVGLTVLAVVVVGTTAYKLSYVSTFPRIQMANTQIKLLENCVTSYYLDTNYLPESLAALDSNIENREGWRGPYLRDSKVPLDPWGNPYLYQNSSSHPDVSFEITSLGADGEIGGDDIDADIHNWQTADQ